MSEQTDTYLVELGELEAQADAFLLQADPQGTDHGLALTRQLRATVKRHRKEIDRIRDEARTEARQELIRERQTEAGFRRLAVPPSARALFSDVDPTDEQAMATRANELREAGIAWPGQPAPEPPKVDANLMAQMAMMATAAGGTHPDDAGDLGARMRAMEATPGRYSDEQREAVVREYNQAVVSRGRPGSGALG